MKKALKSIIAVLLCMVMALGSVSAGGEMLAIKTSAGRDYTFITREEGLLEFVCCVEEGTASCSVLEDASGVVEIPESYTDTETGEEYKIEAVFCSASNVTGLILSKNITRLYSWSFSGESLTDIYYYGSESDRDEIEYSENDSEERSPYDLNWHYNFGGYIAFKNAIVKLATNQKYTQAPSIYVSGLTASDLVWSSTSPSVASVDDSGLVSAHKAGTTVLRASSLDGRYVDTYLVCVGDYQMYITGNKSNFTECGKTANYKISLTESNLFEKVKDQFILKNALDATDEQLSEIAVTIADSSIAKITQISKKSGKIEFTIKGVKEGITYITVTNSATGEVQYFPFYVGVAENTYRIENISSRTIKKRGEYNFNQNGIEIYDYKYKIKDDGSSNVSFNAYNQSCNIGSVDVYDASGNQTDSVYLAQYDNCNETKITDNIENGYYLIKSYFDLDPYDVTSPIWSTCTSVEINVPKDGYFTITNDIEASHSCLIYNGIYLAVAMIFKAAGQANKELGTSITQALSKELLVKFYKTFAGNLALKVSEASIKKMLKSSDLDSETFLKAVAKLFADADLDFWTIFETCGKAIDNELINWSFYNSLEICSDVVGAQSLMFYSAALKTIHKVSSWMQIADLCTDCEYYSGNGAAYIYNTKSGTEKISNGIKAVYEDEEAILRTFEVTYCDAYKSYSEQYDKSKLFDITLVKNNELIQPDSDVVVYIPIPSGWKTSGIKVYRINDDGSKEDMNAVSSNGYMKFSTNHFSIYMLCQESNTVPSISIIGYKDYVTVDYKTTVKLHAEAKNIPVGYSVLWGYYDGTDIKFFEGNDLVINNATKDFAVAACISNGTDDNSTYCAKTETEVVDVKTGFFAKVKAFFKGLFSSLPIYDQK